MSHAVIGQEAQQHVEDQGCQIAWVQYRFHQRNGAHGPVAAQLGRVKQEPAVDGQQVVEGELPGWRGADGRRVIEPATDLSDQTLSISITTSN